MKRTHLETAALLSRKTGRTLVASTGDNGAPHVAPSGEMTLAGAGTVELSYWFCPLTMENLGLNPRCSIVVWDDASNTGFQVLGRVAKTEDLEMLDGFSAGSFENEHVPQVKRKLTVEVERILAFANAPHDDRELGA